VKIPEKNAAAALEIMRRFAVDPRWLIYLPPTMSPASAAKRDGSLERRRPGSHFAQLAHNAAPTVGVVPDTSETDSGGR
jgi:PNKP adenylyltransferase domain, ligase domain